MTEGFQVACPSCEARLKLKDASAAGKRIRCPKCETAFIIPPLAGSPAPKPTRAPASAPSRTSSAAASARKPADTPARKPASASAASSKAAARPAAELDDFLSGLSSINEYEDEAPRAPAPPKRAAAPKEKPKSRDFEEPVPGSEKRGRSRKRNNDDFLSNLGILGWLAGGCVGGLIGGGIWAVIGVFTGFEIGWIAIGVGFVVGLGVRMGAGENYGAAPGITAAGIAVVTILVAKLFVANAHFESLKQLLAELPGQELTMKHVFALQVVEEFEKQGKEIKWPRRGYGRYKETMTAETAWDPEDFPPDVWAEAEKRWNALPEDQRQESMEVAGEEGQALMNEAGFSGVVDMWASDLKRPITIFFFCLAAFSAFRLGSGSETD